MLAKGLKFEQMGVRDAKNKNIQVIIFPQYNSHTLC